MRVNLVNAQIDTERILRDLERGDESFALLRLRELRKSAYNRMYYAERKFKKERPSGIDYQIQKANIKQARIDFERMSAEINNIREYVKHPEKFDYKENRANYYSVQRSFQRINALQAKRAAEAEKLRTLQSEAGDIVGVTLYNVQKSEKINAFLQNVVYKNKLYNFNEAEVSRIAAELKQLTGYDLQQALVDIFDTPQHYESGGGPSQQFTFFESIQNITKELKYIAKGYQGDEMKQIEQLINDWQKMAK